MHFGFYLVGIVITAVIPGGSYLYYGYYKKALWQIATMVGLVIITSASRHLLDFRVFIALNLAFLFVHLITYLHGNILGFKSKRHLGITSIRAFSIPIILCGFLFLGIASAHQNKARLFGFELYHIPSRSMQPTLNVGDIILVDTWVDSSKLEAGQVIVFKKHSRGITLIKRISNLRKSGHGKLELYVLGDNQPLSADSRQFGWLTDDKVIGVAKAKLMPVTQSNFEHFNYPESL